MPLGWKESSPIPIDGRGVEIIADQSPLPLRAVRSLARHWTGSSCVFMFCFYGDCFPMIGIISMSQPSEGRPHRRRRRRMVALALTGRVELVRAEGESELGYRRASTTEPQEPPRDWHA
ncbi:uncharacterized protein H6S33_010169 [Morchella sextelata]|uniref:uncharacterized protein n=1 Tax=Morchella sextelata TaxID=1174677 RepID=UPI001D04E4B1|nr:uncharacterized protein H6S33_010169 [Morchella sextelata]KAH0612117.1 hypothetical protein H6S33_010169 [Morchella sextelata]